MLWTILGWAVVILIILWVVHNPQAAANDVHGLFAFGSDLSH